MDPYLATIILWPGQWIPAGWLACNGQLLQVNTYTALFSLISNIYGGDGRVNFALPNLNGRVPVGAGQLAGTNSIYQLTQTGGVEGVTLTSLQMPLHTHAAAVNLIPGSASGSLPAVTASASLSVTAQAGTTNTPGATNVPASVPGIQVNATTTRPVNAYGPADTVTKWNVPVTAGYAGNINTLNLPVTGSQASATIGNAGGSQVHENRQPFLVMNYIIAVEGLYPPRP